MIGIFNSLKKVSSPQLSVGMFVKVWKMSIHL